MAIRRHALKIALLLVAFSTALIAEAQSPEKGEGYYGFFASSWPCRESLEVFEREPVIHISALWNTFGTDTRCLARLSRQAKPFVLEVHLVNEVCQRNGRCGKYEFLHGKSPRDYERAWLNGDARQERAFREYVLEAHRRISQFIRPQDRLIYSGGLERNLSEAASFRANTVLRNALGGTATYPIVQNPAGINSNKSIAGADYLEVHGSSPRLRSPCLGNLDGEDIAWNSRPALLPNFLYAEYLPRYYRATAACSIAFHWIAEYNAIAKGPFVDPRQRSNWPSPRTFQLIKNLHRRK